MRRAGETPESRHWRVESLWLRMAAALQSWLAVALELLPNIQRVECPPMPSKVLTGAGDQSVEALRRELAEAREQQAATAEIWASISSSVTDASQVFAKIAASAARLCHAHDAAIFQVDGEDLRIVAMQGPIPSGGTLRLTREIVTGCAVLDR